MISYELPIRVALRAALQTCEDDITRPSLGNSPPQRPVLYGVKLKFTRAQSKELVGGVTMAN